MATGKSYPNEEKVEIIDLFDPQWKYEFLNPRIARYGAVGNLVQNKSLICGGIRTMSNKKYLQNGLGKTNAYCLKNIEPFHTKIHYYCSKFKISKHPVVSDCFVYCYNYFNFKIHLP